MCLDHLFCASFPWLHSIFTSSAIQVGSFRPFQVCIFIPVSPLLDLTCYVSLSELLVFVLGCIIGIFRLYAHTVVVLFGKNYIVCSFSLKSQHKLHIFLSIESFERHCIKWINRCSPFVVLRWNACSFPFQLKFLIIEYAETLPHLLIPQLLFLVLLLLVLELSNLLLVCFIERL